MGGRCALSIAGFKINLVFDLKSGWLLKRECLSKARDELPAAGSAAPFAGAEPGTASLASGDAGRHAASLRRAFLQGAAVGATHGETRSSWQNAGKQRGIGH